MAEIELREVQERLRRARQGEEADVYAVMDGPEVAMSYVPEGGDERRRRRRRMPHILLAVESISRKDPHKLAINLFSFKSLYHPWMCLGTTRDHSRAPGAPGQHSKCTFIAFFGPGRAIQNFRLEF